MRVFFSQYDYLVLDEVGLVDNADRGIRLDFVFAWGPQQQKTVWPPQNHCLSHALL